ncbi:5-deoxy-glucuronate isomerase [Anoxynatronum sibiricum]|uniref:5-deoxy-glucuronate isomerase n=1 Tax=Anoxynatronum sibiricum TaxID=210623 RepID=A0ABU9VXP8_9CLOT
MLREELIISAPKPFEKGYNEITAMDGRASEMLMDFGIYYLDKGMEINNEEDLERAYLLLKGKIVYEWDGKTQEASRNSVFEENPWCLHVPAKTKVIIKALASGTEIAEQKTDNEKTFPSKLYTPEECLSEQFGAGTLNETATRTVRTIFDDRNAPDANLVMGEVINHPGKYSSWPPHHHPQPEIYHYRFYPEKGYGHCEIGDDVFKVQHMDTSVLPGGLVHPQTAVPGYAMYYLWMIRHLEGARFSERIFVDEHKWLLDPDAKIWPNK